MNKHRALINILLYSVFVLYLVLLLQTVLFSRANMWGTNDFDNLVSKPVNLIPFYFVKNYITNGNLLTHSFAFRNVFGNIALFVPMGVYVSLIRQHIKILKNLLIIVLISLTIEIIQYILGVGVFDIDDIILNCTGGLIGIAAYNMLILITKDSNRARLAVAVFAPIAGLCLFILFSAF